MINDFILMVIDKIGNNYSDIVIILIVVLALQWFIRFDPVCLGSLNRTLKDLNKKIRQLNAFASDNLKKIHLLFTIRTNRHIRNAWMAFHNEYTSKTLAASPDIREHFNTSAIIGIPAARKKSEAVPGTIIIIGIIGAFIGIFAKTVGNGAEETGAEGLFNNVISSFGIILTAVLISVIYQLIDRHMYHRVLSRLYTFNTLIEQKLAPSDMSGSIIAGQSGEERANTFAASLHQYILPVVESLGDMQRNISETLTKTQAEGMEAMVDSFIAKLNESTGEHFEELKNRTKELIYHQTEAAEKLNVSAAAHFEDIRDKTKELIEYQIAVSGKISSKTTEYFDEYEKQRLELSGYQNELKKSLSEVLSGMVDTEAKQKEINEITFNMLKNLAEYNEKVALSQEQIATSLEKTESFMNMLREILEANKEMNEKINEQRISMQEESAEYFDKINQSSQKTNDDLSYRVEEIFARFTELTGATFEKLETTMNQPLEKLSENIGEMLDRMDEQVRNISLYSKELSVEVLELNRNLGSAVKEFSSQLDGGVKGVLSSFDEGLGEVSSRFATIIGDIKDSADELTNAAADFRKETIDAGEPQ